MEHFCQSHIGLAMLSGLSKSKDGKVTIEKGSEKCQWSGCSNPETSLFKMTYDKGEEPTTTTTGESTTATSETPSQPQEEDPVPA